MTLLLRITHLSRLWCPAAPLELLARVNDQGGSPSSGDQHHEEGVGDCWLADDVSDTFGDEITTKGENIFRVGFQNIGGFPTSRGKFKEDLIRRGIT